MHNAQQTMPNRDEARRVSEQWMAVLDLGVPREAPRREDPLVISVLARLADCMP